MRKVAEIFVLSWLEFAEKCQMLLFMWKVVRDERLPAGPIPGIKVRAGEEGRESLLLPCTGGRINILPSKQSEINLGPHTGE